MELQEPITCPLCSDAENMRFMDPIVSADEMHKWVCNKCGLERFGDPRKGVWSQYDSNDQEM